MGYDLTVLVHQPVDVRRLYAFARKTIGIPQDTETRNGTDGPDGRRYMHSHAIGAAVSLYIEYGVDGPLRGDEYHHGEDWADEREHNGWSAASIRLGSGFGGIDGVHYVVDQLCRYLDSLDVEWRWYDPQRDVEHDRLPEPETVLRGRDHVEKLSQV